MGSTKYYFREYQPCLCKIWAQLALPDSTQIGALLWVMSNPCRELKMDIPQNYGVLYQVETLLAENCAAKL